MPPPCSTPTSSSSYQPPPLLPLPPPPSPSSPPSSPPPICSSSPRSRLCSPPPSPPRLECPPRPPPSPLPLRLQPLSSQDLLQVHHPRQSLRRASVVWFRSNLRVPNNKSLNSAHNESMYVLHIYCFDPRDHSKSTSGFDKIGPYRASFLLESASDLRRSLRGCNSDLVVRVGRLEEVLTEMAKAIGAEAVYVHRQVSRDEVKSEERIEAAMKEEGVEVKYFWGSMLFHELRQFQ